MDNLTITIGIIGGLASIISYLMQLAGVKSKLIHVSYALILVSITAFFIYDSASVEAKNKLLESQVAELKSIEYQAAKILKNSSRGNDGERRGFMLASLAMLEKFKGEQPDTYSMAKEFAIASGVLINEQEDGVKRLQQRWALTDGAHAMEALLKGLAGGAEKET
ncbi:hypothetical protein [Pseudomonas saudimassiliensis]|uniref:hypothetical protein n=1 Tax=Pseudomonas saudimassiliensis TaxID=1461581 RepID=UPI0005C9097E|nr:hypothetical protein [Pseudomonas saudimassiliensis]